MSETKFYSSQKDNIGLKPEEEIINYPRVKTRGNSIRGTSIRGTSTRGNSIVAIKTWQFNPTQFTNGNLL